MNFMFALQHLVKNTYTELHEKPTKGLVTGTMSQVDGCIL